MTETNGTKKKKGSDNYVTTFREGAVAASVFRRTAQGGFEYLDFAISRAWKTSGGKEGYSSQFFSTNREGIHRAVDRACDFIDSQQSSADESTELAGPVTVPDAVSSGEIWM